MAAHPWPDLFEEDRWLIDAMEEVFATSDDTSEDMRARARELREYAASHDEHTGRNAALAMADRWEAAAVARLSAR